jgi:alkanesulfonate monooxygenase SsuD/methylene tetrahydromethanopterin reductase-like flavin-dependent oxidoreductase (luciferase family)
VFLTTPLSPIAFRVCNARVYCAMLPPFAISDDPIMNAASSEARKAIPLAMSVGVARRPIGWASMRIGRSADELIIMPGLMPIVGRTRSEAQVKHDALPRS